MKHNIDSSLLPGWRGRKSVVSVDVWHAPESAQPDRSIEARPFHTNGVVRLTAFDANGRETECSVGHDSNPFIGMQPPAHVTMPVGGWVLFQYTGPGKSYTTVDVDEHLWDKIDAKREKAPEIGLLGRWVLACHIELNPRGRKEEREHRLYGAPQKEIEHAWQVGLDECLQAGLIVSHGKGFKVSDLGHKSRGDLKLDHYKLGREVIETLKQHA